MHVHVTSGDGEAKFWVDPHVALATGVGYADKQLRELHALVEEHRDEICRAWQRHFG